MTKDEVIALARDAKMFPASYFNEAGDGVDGLVRFAELVAAKEREECAKACDGRYMGDNNREDMEVRKCADAIRARGKV